MRVLGRGGEDDAPRVRRARQPVAAERAAERDAGRDAGRAPTPRYDADMPTGHVASIGDHASDPPVAAIVAALGGANSTSLKPDDGGLNNTMVLLVFLAGFGTATMVVGAVAACYVQSKNAQAKRIGGVYSKVNTVDQAEVEMAGSPLGDDDVDDIDDILAEGVSDQ